MISTGNINSLNRIIRKYEIEHYLSFAASRKLRAYVRKQHRIGDSDLYNLTNVEVTCRVFEARWYEGK